MRVRTEICQFLLANLLTAIVSLFRASEIWAEDYQAQGHVKYQGSGTINQPESLAGRVDGSSSYNQTFEARLKVTDQLGDFSARIDGEILGGSGDSFGSTSPLRGVIQGRGSRLPDDSRRIFRLSRNVSDGARSEAVARLDRLYLERAKDNFVLKVGREALTWGNGFVFQTIDPFNPFSPTEIDKEYKSGDDMIYAQYLFSSGADLQLVFVPRRDLETQKIEYSESSLASKLHGKVDDFQLDYDLVVGQHYGDRLLGLGLSRQVLSAIVRLNLGMNLLEQGQRTTLLANVDRSLILWGKNFYWFLEYYHSDFGLTQARYALPDTEISERLSRGELYTLGKDYLAPGLRVEATPRLNFYISDIYNLHDTSAVIQFRATFDAWQNVLMTAGVNAPYGARGSEFGGVDLPGVDTFASAGIQLYLRAALYF